MLLFLFFLAFLRRLVYLSLSLSICSCCSSSSKHLVLLLLLSFFFFFTFNHQLNLFEENQYSIIHSIIAKVPFTGDIANLMNVTNFG
uniref:Uncharacterized protein n=1 Tax=Salix viminalis TaxID=40686 RepID=A0A6N2KC82_SALVM